MNKIKTLPPGSMRRQLRRGRIQGAVGLLLLQTAIAGAVVVTAGDHIKAASPVARYAPLPTPPAWAAPTARASAGLMPAADPCYGTKENSDPCGLWDARKNRLYGAPLVPYGGTPAPHAAPQQPTHKVPEPNTAALLVIGLGLLVAVGLSKARRRRPQEQDLSGTFQNGNNHRRQRPQGQDKRKAK